MMNDSQPKIVYLHSIGRWWITEEEYDDTVLKEDYTEYRRHDLYHEPTDEEIAKMLFGGTIGGRTE